MSAPEKFVQIVPSGKNSVYGLTSTGRIFQGFQGAIPGITSWELLPLPDFSDWTSPSPVPSGKPKP